MFDVVHTLAANIVFLSVLAFMGWYDHKNLMLEPWSLAILVLMCIRSNYWQVIALAAIGYGIMFLAAVIGDVVCQRDSIAGGDMIISGVCCAYMGLHWFAWALFISAVLGQFAVWGYYCFHRHLDIPYVPYLATGALIGSVIR